MITVNFSNLFLLTFKSIFLCCFSYRVYLLKFSFSVLQCIPYFLHSIYFLFIAYSLAVEYTKFQWVSTSPKLKIYSLRNKLEEKLKLKISILPSKSWDLKWISEVNYKISKGSRIRRENFFPVLPEWWLNIYSLFPPLYLKYCKFANQIF